MVFGAQSGKSELMLDVAGQRLDQRPGPILYVGPNKQFLTEQFEFYAKMFAADNVKKEEAK